MRNATRWLLGTLVVGCAVGMAGTASAAEPETLRFDPLALPTAAWAIQTPDEVKGDGDMSEIAKGLGAILSKSRELATERFEVRVGAYLWFARIKKAESKASSDDMRAGRANGYIAHTAVTTRDFDKDFGMSDFGDPAIIVNPEVMLRYGPSVIRLSWWQWTGGGTKVITEDIAYGDRTYRNGSTIDGDALLSDIKLIYEYRVTFDSKLSVFTGVSLHFVRTVAEFTYSSAWGWDDYGCPLGSGSTNGVCDDIPPSVGAPQFADTERPIEGVPLISISVRSEWTPVENVMVTFDSQSMYLPFTGSLGYGYTDTRLGLWVQASKYAQLGVGGRFWFLWAKVAGLDKHDTEFEGRFQLQGYWAAVMFRFP